MADKQQYVLMRIDKPVLLFTSNKYSILEVNEIIDKSLFPLGMKGDLQSFSDWWKSHMVPSSRDSIERGLSLLHIDTPNELKLVTHGLSLTNQYWIKKPDENINWKDINLYDNDFSDEIGHALFKNYPPASEDFRKNFGFYSFSPEGTNIGDLKKFWTIRNNERLLIKSSGMNNEEGANEILAGLLCEELGIPYIKYQLSNEDGYIGCISKLMNDNHTEILSFYDMFEEDKGYGTFKKIGQNWKEYTVELLNKLDIPYAEEKLDAILCLDYIMSQTDRHYNNLSILHDIDNELYDIAPVYDSGKANHYADLTKFIDIKGDVMGRPFSYSTFISLEEQIKLVKYPIAINKKNIDKAFNQYISTLEFLEKPKERINVLYDCLVYRTEKYNKLMEKMNLEPKDYAENVPTIKSNSI